MGRYCLVDILPSDVLFFVFFFLRVSKKLLTFFLNKYDILRALCSQNCPNLIAVSDILKNNFTVLSQPFLTGTTSLKKILSHFSLAYIKR